MVPVVSHYISYLEVGTSPSQSKDTRKYQIWIKKQWRLLKLFILNKIIFIMKNVELQRGKEITYKFENQPKCLPRPNVQYQAHKLHCPSALPHLAAATQTSLSVSFCHSWWAGIQQTSSCKKIHQLDQVSQRRWKCILTTVTRMFNLQSIGVIGDLSGTGEGSVEMTGCEHVNEVSS